MTLNLYQSPLDTNHTIKPSLSSEPFHLSIYCLCSTREFPLITPFACVTGMTPYGGGETLIDSEAPELHREPYKMSGIRYLSL